MNEPAAKSFDDYRRSLRALTRGYWAGQLAAFDFVDGMASAVNRHFEQAWEQGEQINGVQPGERSDEEKTRLQLEINTEISHIVGFADAIAENSKANNGALQPLLDRAELWANAYARITTLSQLMSGSDLKYRWVLGDTIQHCPSCEGYAGKIYRASVWRETLEPNDLMPQGKNLSCGGWQCKCYLEVTTDRASPGKPPILAKAKATDTPEVHVHTNGIHHDELKPVPA